MRKVFILSLIFLLSLPISSYAISIGGAETVGKGKWSLGFDYEHVFHRKLKFLKTNVDTFGTVNAGIKDMRRAMFKASYGLWNNLDVYVKLGTANLKAESTPFLNPNIYNGDTHLRTKDAVAYGLGLKGAFSLKNGWGMGVDLQYLRHKNKTYGRTPRTNGTTQKTKGETTIQEWQVAPYLSKKIGNLLPYVGLKYSGLRGKVRAKYTGLWDKSKEDVSIGTFIGADYKMRQNWVLNFEARFIDETAASLGATYKF